MHGNMSLKDAVQAAMSSWTAQHDCRRPRQADLSSLSGIADHRFSLILTGAQLPRVEEKSRLLWVLNFLHGKVGDAAAPHTSEGINRMAQRTRLHWLDEQRRLADISLDGSPLHDVVRETEVMLRSPLGESSRVLADVLRNRPKLGVSGAAKAAAERKAQTAATAPE